MSQIYSDAESGLPNGPRKPETAPVLTRTGEIVRVMLGERVVAETRDALRVDGDGHPPRYYLPPTAFRPGVLRPARGRLVCRWKGSACCFDLALDGAVAESAAWSYPNPTYHYTALRDHLGIDPARVACLLNEEPLQP